MYKISSKTATLRSIFSYNFIKLSIGLGTCFVDRRKLFPSTPTEEVARSLCEKQGLPQEARLLHYLKGPKELGVTSPEGACMCTTQVGPGGGPHPGEHPPPSTAFLPLLTQQQLSRALGPTLTTNGRVPGVWKACCFLGLLSSNRAEWLHRVSLKPHLRSELLWAACKLHA